ncbi:hypothetical protein Q7C36_000728 [Tachysurus vachellii]|uniref:Uncharacterized protein n=1 Tax=Tachysurus vachellii TaxID=175792 RepID=A0AA88P1Y0_TACVA|nr:hypothetical protein Q7C36_000728 [Tachysurus vachellii]
MGSHRVSIGGFGRMDYSRRSDSDVCLVFLKLHRTTFPFIHRLFCLFPDSNRSSESGASQGFFLMSSQDKYVGLE